MKFKISELSQVLGVTSTTLRRYEKQGYIIPERDKWDYRWYNYIDIIKMIEIRLLRKTGFSHEDITAMISSPLDKMREVSVNRLEAIDEELHRLKYLRHWLKDNICLIDNMKMIGEGFFNKDCPAQKYVIYGTNGKLFREEERLKTIYDFLYTIEEVKSIMIFKYSDDPSKLPEPYYGIAVKEQDVSRLGIEDIISNNKYIETYPCKPCIYSVIECEKTDESAFAAYKSFYERTERHLEENSLKRDGDIMGFVLDVLGDKEYFLMCVPVKQIL